MDKQLEETKLTVPEEEPKERKLERARVLKSKIKFGEGSPYEISDQFVPATEFTPQSVHTTSELVTLLERDENVEIDARVLALDPKTRGRKYVRLDKKAFIEAVRRTNPKLSALKESDFDSTSSDTSSGNVGSDFVPLLGGPFNKQTYYHDYLRMHAQSFYVAHHDPIGRAYLNIVRDFTLGRGWRVDCDNPIALALWRAFEDANDLYQLMEHVSWELACYGEVLLWELPNNATKIGFQLRPGQEVPRGTLPRYRLIDPSVIWEIVTYPEDITRVLFYQWVAPTQYQTYSGVDKGQPVSGSKFIFQQIPAEEVMHEKINCVSNEKRGRSDFYPVLGYMKRLRDAVNYSLIAMQKSAAWSIDTTIEGQQADVDAYVDAISALGTIPEAGSEFAHTSKIKRDYLSNSATSKGGGGNMAFEWSLSMASAGLGIPMSYWGTHLSGGQTRASALVATEPVAKKFQQRQAVYERMLKKMAARLFKRFGIQAEIEVTFPQLIEQDRSAKIKDLFTCEKADWISKERAASIAAKELGITEFNWKEEKAKIESEESEGLATDPAGGRGAQSSNPLTAVAGSPNEDPKPSAVTQAQRRALSVSGGI